MIFVELTYFKGLLLSDEYIPGLEYNSKFRKYVAFAYKYRYVREYAKRNDLRLHDKVLELLPVNVDSSFKGELRSYQKKAVESWITEKRGVIVMPTGSGKTLVALRAIYELNTSTLIVVPTLELLNQWFNNVQQVLGVTPGRIGGGYDDISGTTVITYDSAYIRIEELGNKFELLVFDEVHHLPAEGYIQIAQMSAAPYRMGLTATVEREDNRHVLLNDIVGPVIFKLTSEELKGKYLSDYDMETIRVNLLPEERESYLRNRQLFKDFVQKKRIRFKSPNDFKKLVSIASKSRDGRDALLAWQEATSLAVNSEAKIHKLEELLPTFKNEKVIIFTRNNSMAYKISSKFLIPIITYRTPKEERQRIIANFREGKYKMIVTSNVLDEGVDFPDANVAIVLGGYGSRRQFIQRLGRILRKVEGKRAKLIEIVTSGTIDSSLSRRRKRVTG
ncbi:helicase [Sulfolobales archaeon HS-7]|nr:helicase [Sulfolobales archaeon HS-7]